MPRAIYDQMPTNSASALRAIANKQFYKGFVGMRQPFRVHVKQLGSGYLAENASLSICVGGSSAADAAEKARAMALELFAHYLQEARPSTLIARIDTEECIAFVMQPFDKPFCLGAGELQTVY